MMFGAIHSCRLQLNPHYGYFSGLDDTDGEMSGKCRLENKIIDQLYIHDYMNE